MHVVATADHLHLHLLHVHPPAHVPCPAGATRLSQAQASARLNEQQQLSFNVEVVPAEGHRQSGYVRASGTVPLVDAAAAPAVGATAVSSRGAGEPAQQQQQQQQQLDVRLSVKDSGMAILTSVTPDVHWQQGQASIDLRLRGSLMQPVLSGGASITKATLDCPLLRFPLTNVSAEVRAGEDLLTVESLEARCGRRGFVRARGRLPVYGASTGSSQHKLVAEASGLELRLRNMYSGQYDASLLVTSSLANPTVAGSMRFSKGIVFIVPQGAPGAPPFSAAAAAAAAPAGPAQIQPTSHITAQLPSHQTSCCGCCCAFYRRVGHSIWRQRHPAHPHRWWRRWQPTAGVCGQGV